MIRSGVLVTSRCDRLKPKTGAWVFFMVRSKFKFTLLAVALAVLLVIALTWLGLRERAPDRAATSVVVGAASSKLSATSAIATTAPLPMQWPDVAVLTQRLVNPVERAADLSSMYDRYSGSVNPLERNIAYRAWSACFPAFMSTDGNPVAVEQFARAMPLNAANNGQRLAAYGELRARCQRFFLLSRDEIVDATQRQENAWKKGEMLSPGELAMKQFLEGRSDEAVDVARRTVQSGDAYAIASLQEYIHRMIAQKIETQQLPNRERSDLRGLAFATAACQLGLDCSADSLTALLLCANGGQCVGSLTDRYLQALPDAADRERAMRITERTLAAIRAQDFAMLGLEKTPP